MYDFLYVMKNMSKKIGYLILLLIFTLGLCSNNRYKKMETIVIDDIEYIGLKYHK